MIPQINPPPGKRPMQRQTFGMATQPGAQGGPMSPSSPGGTIGGPQQVQSAPPLAMDGGGEDSSTTFLMPPMRKAKMAGSMGRINSWSRRLRRRRRRTSTTRCGRRGCDGDVSAVRRERQGA